MSKLARHYAAQARTASGVNILLGLWLIVSPWVFDYSGKSAVLYSVTVGALIALLAAVRVVSLHDSAGLSGINLLLAFWTGARSRQMLSRDTVRMHPHTETCVGRAPAAGD